MSRTILSVAYPFAPAGPDTAGGAEQVLTLIERALHESGHCSVVVASEGSQVAGELLPTPAVSGLLTEEARVVVRELHHQNILRALEQYEVDLVHIHAVDFPSYLPPPGVPVLVTLHLPVSWYSPDPFRTLRPDTWFNCVSHSQALDCPESSRLLGVVENGVPVTDLRPNGSKDGFALALGRICPEKNFHSALDAAERAGLPLVLAGEVFPYETHQAYFRDEIQPRLNSLRQFIGPVGFDRKRELLGRARCLLLPSLCRETSSLVAMEALACGTPVVAFDSGAIPEIIEHGVTGFIVRSVAEMAQALMRASEISPARCREAAESRFSARRMVQDYLALYERILSLPRSRSTRLAPEDRATRQVRVARSSLKAKVITRFDDLLRLARAWSLTWRACGVSRACCRKAFFTICATTSAAPNVKEHWS